jgi:uncharacterized membrane protein
MAKDLNDMLRDKLGDAGHALKNLSPPKLKSNPLSGAKGVAAGAGLAALPLVAKKGIDAVRSRGDGDGAGSKVGDKLGDKLKETASQKIDDAGGLGGIAKQAAGGVLGGGSNGGGGGVPGVGKGRRMPVQQSVDVAVPVETAYNQFTQFEDWPEFMHRVTRVTKEDDCTVSFSTKIWTRTREFTADIESQRPDERIKWSVSQGITHTGVVTFHELAPRLTRIELNMDVEPGGLIEKAARGMRHVKRAARADLHRFKAFIEMQEQETGAWRGVIEDGELVEEHPEDYDAQRDYSDIEDAQPDEESAEEAESGEQEQPESSDDGSDGSGRRREGAASRS